MLALTRGVLGLLRPAILSSRQKFTTSAASSAAFISPASRGEPIAQQKPPHRISPQPASTTTARSLSSTTAPNRWVETTNPDEMAPKFELKTPKGTKDWDGKNMVIRDKIFSTITDVFKRHGGVTIDTPVFELKEVLTGKYGEDSKLIYDLADQGGELCSLRYDLTVPFARYLAMHRDIQNIRRYHIAKVYRRDQPAMSKGRMREFYQCDFDIAGAYDPMIPDAEIIKIITQVFDKLGWAGTYTVKLNHRKILDGLFQVCGVPDQMIRTISSAVDKLDKLPWAEVRKEMTEEKGLPGEVADRIGEWVVLKGKQDLLDKLRADEALSANASMKQGMDDMQLLLGYLEKWKALDVVSFDLSLARGLDYYTGVIYEVVTEGSAPGTTPAGEKEEGAKPQKKKKKKGPKNEDDDRSDDPSVGVGSVAAGGRYDDLVGMFAGKGQIPCVGISFGVDRIFSITEARMAADKSKEAVRSTEVDVFVMAVGGKGFTGMLDERMEVVDMLWDAEIKAEILYKVKPKLPNQFKAADDHGVPFAVILGEDEWAEKKVKVKELGLQEGHPEKEGVIVPIGELVKEVRKRLHRKKELDEVARQADGLRVVHGIKGEPVVPVPTEMEKPGEEKPGEAKSSEEATPEVESTEASKEQS